MAASLLPLVRAAFAETRVALVAASVLAMLGCTAVPGQPTAPAAPPATVTAPAAPVAPAEYTAIGPDATAALPPPAVTAAPQLLLQDGDSRIELRLDRDGPLARLGHRHVIVTRAVHGVASFDPAHPTSATFRAAFRVDSLQVDDPAERAAAGAEFATLPDAAAIAGTRKNLLSAALLDAERFPEIELRLQQLMPAMAPAITPTTTPATTSAPAPAPAPARETDFTATVVFTMKGAEHALLVPVQVVPLGDGGYAATGEWTVTHAELGLTPYSAAGGLVKVADAIEVRFRLVAKPM